MRLDAGLFLLLAAAVLGPAGEAVPPAFQRGTGSTEGRPTDPRLRLDLNGDWRFLRADAGVDNGDPATTAPFQADHRAAFNGLALLIVRSIRGTAGPVRIEAASPGLTTGVTGLRTLR